MRRIWTETAGSLRAGGRPVRRSQDKTFGVVDGEAMYWWLVIPSERSESRNPHAAEVQIPRLRSG
jgi:hypothetical protein